MPTSRLIILLFSLMASILRAAAQDKPSTTTFRARCDRAMQTAPNALVLVRSRSSAMADNQDGFRQDAAFYYLTGLENAAGALLLLDSRR
ncbi:MAG TPA: aminopeptidase P N-terminal domain-containing protein, partial [Pyrinomonadaceae bacterium]